jgi:hypothetical protein
VDNHTKRDPAAVRLAISVLIGRDIAGYGPLVRWRDRLTGSEQGSQSTYPWHVDWLEVCMLENGSRHTAASGNSYLVHSTLSRKLKEMGMVQTAGAQLAVPIYLRDANAGPVFAREFMDTHRMRPSAYDKSELVDDTVQHWTCANCGMRRYENVVHHCPTAPRVPAGPIEAA